MRGSSIYAPKALCVLSRHPFLTSLRRWLSELYRHSLTGGSGVPLERLIGQLLWECPLPPAGHVSVCLPIGNEEITFVRPAAQRELPVSEQRFSTLLHAISPAQLLTLFTAALSETKIILVSAYLSQLTAAAEALTCLLWPMVWQGVYIPLLPSALIDIVDSPVPYILGIHSEAYDAAAAAGAIPDDALVARLDGSLFRGEAAEGGGGAEPGAVDGLEGNGSPSVLGGGARAHAAASALRITPRVAATLPRLPDASLLTSAVESCASR